MNDFGLIIAMIWYTYKWQILAALRLLLTSGVRLHGEEYLFDNIALRM